MSKKNGNVRAKIIKGQSTVRKSDTSQNIKASENSYSEWLTPDVSLTGLEHMVQHSSILPQCINAYKSNIAGFGIGVRYKEDVTDNEKLENEFKRLQEVIDCLTFECDTKEVFENIVAAREIYGIAYLEIIRNAVGEVAEISFIENVPSIEKSRQQGEYIDVQYNYNGKMINRKKQFCRYRQRVNFKTVYFKEFGDTRIMNKDTGDYVTENIPPEMQANEILEFRLGSKPYGQVRWIGQTLGIDGSRKAESLNNNYFENGRHTPLAIILNGGTLTNDSFEKLETYMNDIKGEAGQHSFLLLEAENNSNKVDFTEESKPDIKLQSLADILQHDELFQDYLENNRKKVQSAFRLPDLYVGYTSEFNRATAQMAMEVTEEQVFQTERQSLAWIINNILLACYNFEHVEAYFKEPDISNPDDLYKILTVCNNAGGLTPNKAKEIIYSAFGEVSDDFDGDWGNIPLAYLKHMASQTSIEKSDNGCNDEMVAVMKSVRSMLRKMSKGG